MTEHTPGPWEVGNATWDEDGDVMYALKGNKVACAPDARLIAAAPDLLDALEAILAADERGQGLPFAEAMDAGVAARAKARGM